ncbi:GDP-L-fucose synthase [Candidatus Xianfuyuplasma coldseepsis]|uniref:GDP-L-fucose synthase n=1 Tax=Candidatus Xianfuyuplasma coldseepsis TaxID=2782163 RepID=A0A7L7KQ07_9MOLU|nr:GDP-L-fucose synthase [Xianfuyuplasma coldseepsis]QMS84519.1 GDP-L-fucose synthase [Xianfuyuplasma coldseepsis]
MDYNSKIYVAGHRGMVGSAIVRNLKEKGYNNIISKEFDELNLISQMDVEEFFENEKPEYVFLAAAKVGGIFANSTFPAEFIYDNLMIEANVINTAYKNNVKKLLFLGSSCIYPKFAPQPMKEEYLLTGTLETTNEAYAIAKITGIELCKFYRRQYGCDFISVMPTNLYGINDNFDLETSHVLPALLRKFHEAKINNEKEVVMWGTGKPKREFLYVDDLADACIYLMENYSDESHLNIGTGVDVEIIELANIIKNIVGYKGDIVNDLTKPDGTPRKLLDVSKLNATGWKHQITLQEGIKKVYDWYLTTNNIRK